MVASVEPADKIQAVPWALVDTGACEDLGRSASVDGEKRREQQIREWERVVNLEGEECYRKTTVVDEGTAGEENQTARGEEHLASGMAADTLLEDLDILDELGLPDPEP